MKKREISDGGLGRRRLAALLRGFNVDASDVLLSSTKHFLKFYSYRGFHLMLTTCHPCCTKLQYSYLALTRMK